MKSVLPGVSAFNRSDYVNADSKSVHPSVLSQHVYISQVQILLSLQGREDLLCQRKPEAHTKVGV